MLSPRFTRCRRIVGCCLAPLLLNACAGIALEKAPGSAAEARRDNAVESARLDSTVPPRVLTLYEQAAALMAAGDFLDAELRFKEFLLQYPEYPGAHINLAIIHANNDNVDAAQASLDAALALNPDNPAALNQLGMLLRRNGKFIEAEAAYLKAVTVSPDYALAHYNLGVLNELYLRRLDVALHHFENYQALVGEDKQVAKWINDLRRRVAAAESTASLTD